MKLLLLAADQPGQLTQLRELLGSEYSLFTAATVEEGLDYLRMTRVDVVIAAFTDPDISIESFLQQTKSLQPHCATLYIAPPYQSDDTDAGPQLPTSDFHIRRPFHREELLQVVGQATAKQRLDEELDILRGHAAPPLTTPRQPASAADEEALRSSPIGPILRNFTKAFSTNFDLQRALMQFLDAIAEFVRPSRQSIMVWNPVSRLFEIRAERGLPPQVIGQLNLPRDGGLAEWLWREGRLIQRSEVERQLHVPAFLDIHRDMQALKAAVCIPLLSSGSLLGILNLGDRVTGGLYLPDELEILFSLSSHIAVGIQDIALHHEVQAQKMFTEKILRYMGSGVITIDTDERITLCNHRAAEILGTTWSEAQSAHVRILPAPLGDLLLQTLHQGITFQNHRVVLADNQLPMRVHTYQIHDDQGAVAGCVIVFDDLTYQKLLDEERRRTSQLEFLNKVVGRMAHEIKNPLVSIQTFAELLNDHYDDPEFRNHFRRVVSNDIQTIDGITEKLVGFAGDIHYQFEYDDLNRLLEQLVSAHVKESKAAHPNSNGADSRGAFSCGMEIITTDDLPSIKFDSEQLRKALGYLAAFLEQGIENDGTIILSSQRVNDDPKLPEGDWACIQMTGQGRKLPPEELQHLFDPFDMSQNTLIDVGPCVSQKIIEEHGGRLNVHQEANGDTTFTIALPITH